MQSDDESDDDTFESSQGGSRNFVPVKDSLLFGDTGKYDWFILLYWWENDIVYQTANRGIKFVEFANARLSIYLENS